MRLSPQIWFPRVGRVPILSNSGERARRLSGRGGSRRPGRADRRSAAPMNAELSESSDERSHRGGPLRIFLAGATGVIGRRLVPLLVADGHTVAGMTRSREKLELLRTLGADPVLCDVFDEPLLTEAVCAFRPDAVLHQLTDLPDRPELLGEFAARNDRIRTEGTRNLLAAAKAARVQHFLAQSIAWRPAGRGESVAQHERMVLEAGGVVVRYGQLYGPGTFYEHEPPAPPRIHVDDAARATPALIDAPTGVVILTEDAFFETASAALGTQAQKDLVKFVEQARRRYTGGG
jgi:nucleoside-diphosphate-sugar epimerase